MIEDDDDIGAMWREIKKERQAKRAANRDSSASLLIANGIKFAERNMGAHLIVEGRIDFWPGTGLWIDRNDHKHHRGVMKLIRYVLGSPS